MARRIISPKPKQPDAPLFTAEQIRSMTERNIFDLILAIEREHDIRFGVVTRSDVNDVFRNAIEVQNYYDDDGKPEIEPRDMTDAEWEEFSQDWFWQKGHSEIFWDGDVSLAIHEDLQDRKILPIAGAK